MALYDVRLLKEPIWTTPPHYLQRRFYDAADVEEAGQIARQWLGITPAADGFDIVDPHNGRQLDLRPRD